MASTAYQRPVERVSIGRVLGRAFGVMGDNPLTVFGLAFLLGGLPQIGFLLAGSFVTMDVVQSFGIAGTFAVGAAGIMLWLLVNCLLQGALVRATVGFAAGRRAGFGECLRVGLAAALPLLVMSILIVIGYAIGFALLIVPAVLLYVRWAVAVPVLVEERLGVFASLGRSSGLSRGARWRIFGLGLVTLVIVWFASALIGVVTGTTGGLMAIGAGGPSTAVLLMSAASSTLIGAFWSAVPTALYVELRDWKDGPAVERLVDVFA